MKIRLVSIACCLLVAGVASVQAVNVDMGFEARAKATSEYLWRGKVISDDWCIQPSVRAEGNGFSLEAWGTWDLTSASNSSERTRMDVTLEYAGTWNEKIIGRAGIIAYIYKDSLVVPWQKDTFETYVGADLLVPSLPSLTVYYDFTEIDGFYATLSFMHRVDLLTKENERGKKIRDWSLSLDMRGDVGLADKNYNAKMFDSDAVDSAGEQVYEPKTSLVDFTGVVALPLSMGQNVTLEPAVKYMTLIDSRIRNSVDNAGEDTDGVAYSLTLSVVF